MVNQEDSLVPTYLYRRDVSILTHQKLFLQEEKELLEKENKLLRQQIEFLQMENFELKERLEKK